MPRNHQINDSMASSSLFLLFLFYKLNRIIIHILINHFLPWRFDLRCFPLELKRQPSRYQNFEAQSHSLFSRCLRLATTITGSHPRLATGGWLDLTRQAFHLLDYSPLSGRTIPICISVCFKNGQSRLELPTHCTNYAIFSCLHRFLHQLM